MKVLIGSIARLLQGLAEMLGRWAVPAPQQVPAWSPMPTAEAPEDWVRRAVPPPPAHWLAVVRARAPHFQPLDPRAPRVAPETPSFSPVLRSKAAPVAAPMMRAPKNDVPSLPVARRPIPGPVKPPSVAPRRVVTIVEEQPARPKRKSSDIGPNVFTRSAPTPMAEPSPFLHRPPGAPWPTLQPVEESSIEPVESELRTERGNAAFAATPAFSPAFAKASAGVVAATQPSVRKNIVPEPMTSVPAQPKDVVPALPEPKTSWPTLPETPAERPEDVCRALLREARIEEELSREHRGMPWSA